VPEKDAFLAKQLREAGAIIIAKVNLHEFAVWGETLSSILGQTINPYDLTRSPGGSSGGTGAGIAANFGLIGIGTDTINSIRSPASACSLVGFRPTVGLVSRAGVVPYALTQDTAGPIMKTVEDTARVLDVISGWDEDEQMTAWSLGNIPKSYVDFLDKDGLRGKRIGILNSFFGKEKIHEEVNRIMYKDIEVMKNQGAILIPIEEDINADELVGDVSLHLYELKTDLSKYLHNLGTKSRVHSLQDVIDSGKFHEGIKENILFANTLDKGTDIYNKRMIKRLEVRNFLVELMAKYDLDALVYPHQKRPVVKVNEPQVDRNGVLGSVTGFPSIVVPGGFTKPTETAPIGIPVGIEFLGREWSEATLFQIAYGFEQATNYRKPPKL
ncbi:MAG: amidase, partial [Tissierellia bacterium]|nr:amidase [Tissierellia bacterium]